MAVIALAQFSASENPDVNMAVITRLVGDAAGGGASVVVLPEYASCTPPVFDRRLITGAQPLDGPFVTALSCLAATHGVAIIGGMAELVPGSPRVHNTVVAVVADGSLAATYRKVHLYDALGVCESDLVAPGDPHQVAVVDIGGLRVGIQTCYDLRFPESTRVLADAGADVVVVPSQWVPGPHKVGQWTTLLGARAIENAVYVAGAGQSGPTGAGHSRVVDPHGVVVVADLADDTAVALAHIDTDLLAAVRNANPVLAARRFAVVPRDGHGGSL